MLELISSSAGVKSPSMLFVLLLGLKSHPTRCAGMRFRLLVVLSMFAISTIAAPAPSAAVEFCLERAGGVLWADELAARTSLALASMVAMAASMAFLV